MSNKKMCDCKECHATDDVKQALIRLEKRDETNVRLISEMAGQINNLTTEIKVISKQINKVLQSQQSLQRPATATITTSNLQSDYQLASDIAEIKNALQNLKNNRDSKK
jgi:hypothetical protein